MAKKKESGVKKWIVGAGLSIVVIPILTFSWHNIQCIWASPEAIDKVSKKVDKQESSQEQVAHLLLEEKARNDKQDAVYEAQMQSVKEQLKLIAELKGRK